MDAAAVDDMPPTGNQPVRAAISTSTNEVTSGGTDTNNSDSARMASRQRAPALLRRARPVTTPRPTPASVATINADTASTAVFRAARATRPRTGRL